MKNNNFPIETIRHSCEHVMAAAIMSLWPETKRGVGPAIENGFYQDLEIPNYKITPEDLPKIEKKMEEIKKAKIKFVKQIKNIDEAINHEKNLGQVYKVAILEELKIQGEKEVTYYNLGGYLDLCRGPHVNDSSQIGFFKLERLAGAYFQGDEKKPMLQRIYGLCFETKEKLDQYIWQQKEAEKRDHKKLGKLLDLFIIPEELGSGLLIWTPKGAVIRQEIEKFIISEQTKRGYLHVYSPHIGKKSLWVTSGHWDLYRDKMYSPIKIDEDEYLVKPMNCPMHMMVYKSRPRSYKELPLRIAENATVYRYERPGELSGMTRVRYITQDDSHIFCTKQQVVSEFISVLDYIVFLLKSFQISDYSFRLSLRDPKNKDKYLGDDNIWQEAENAIEMAVKKKNIKYEKREGEAAFYGPKLDVMIKDALGRQWQCGTIQIDFMLPERFALEYIDEKGQRKQPALIHRAPLGSLERFVGILIEHYAGNFPLWLSPIQVNIIPIAERHKIMAENVQKELLRSSIRTYLDDRNESMQAKIRDATLQKVPYMIIIGDRELQNKKNPLVCIRTREGKDLGQMSISLFLNKLQEEIEKKH